MTDHEPTDGALANSLLFVEISGQGDGKGGEKDEGHEHGYP